MGTRTVQAERIFTGAHFTMDPGRYGFYRAQLLNEASSEVWHCQHRHRSSAVAHRCSETERRRWVRSGKGRA